MSIRPQDVVAVLAIETGAWEKGWTFPELAQASGLSLSEAHAAVKRAAKARLLIAAIGSKGFVVARENLLEFLVHGVKYAFPAERGRVTRGVPTAHSAPVLAEHIVVSDDDVLVWPHATGGSRGEAMAPLYKTVPDIALQNAKLYDALALVDAIRAGRARERKLAAELLEARIISDLSDEPLMK